MLVDIGATDFRSHLYVEDSAGSPVTGLAHDTAGLSLYYHRAGAAAAVSIPLEEQTALDGTHVDGGFIEVDATNQPGLYQIDWPDAVFASGAASAVATFRGTGIKTVQQRFELAPPITVVSGAVESYPSAGGLGDIQTAAEAGASAALSGAEPLQADVRAFGGNPISGTGKSGDPVTAVP